MTFQFRSLNQINRYMFSIYLVQGTPRGPLGTIEMSDPTEMGLTNLFQVVRYMKFSVCEYEIFT